jgi:acyl transferase domain-containing protein
MWGDDAGGADRTGFTQPALFAVEVALFRLLESWGVGRTSWPGTRSASSPRRTWPGCCPWRTPRAGRGARPADAGAAAGGAMVAIQATEDEVAPLLTGEGACRSPRSTAPASVVVSGARTSRAAVAAAFAERGRKTKRLRSRTRSTRR